MPDQSPLKTHNPVLSIEHVTEPLSAADLNDLCDASDAAIGIGGGFGWLSMPARETMERYWQGVITAPTRWLFIARLDNVICGTAQLILPPPNNEAQKHAVHLTTNFVAPWARGHGLARGLIDVVERKALESGYSVINLDVRETMTNAIQLYESKGYKQFGSHPFYARVDGKPVAGRYYYKIIDPKMM